MRTRSRRFWIGATAIALSWVLGHSQTGQAQLFPNLPIQRPKPPCDQEAPFYKMVRQNYYGYFPTCWRKFPPGWTAPCPNPEKPDYEASKAKIPLQKDPDTFLQSGGGMGLGGEDEFGPLPPANGGNREGRKPGPDLPGGRSPFDLDNPPANPPGGRNPAASPFDLPPPNGAGASARRSAQPVASARRSAQPVASLPNLGELTPAPSVNSPTTDSPPAAASPESPPAIPDPAVGPTSASRILTPSTRKPGLLGGVRGLFGGDRR